jgi:hypothetical protein
VGCDIEMHAERKQSDGSWVVIPLQLTDPSWRYYRAFAALADVRNPGNVVPISIPRGIPDDSPLAEGTRNKEPGNFNSDNAFYDSHSHTWLLLREVFDYDWNAWGITGIDDGPPLFVCDLQKQFTEPEDRDNVRLVFWFDN